LFELTESLIRIFRLGEQKGELPHLQAFQNLVLDFYTRERNDLGAFMEWWEENKVKKSIPVSGNVDAAQVITVHKSKGLQFGYVIIPFCSWSMDHDSFKAPNLWVKGSVPPFDSGYLPVKYSSALEQTVFREAYKTEFTRTYLDNMNLLYVALTRAENGLVIIAPDPAVKSQKKSVAQVLYKSIMRSSVLAQTLKPAEGSLKYGEWKAAPVKYAAADHAIELATYVSSNWREKLVIRHDANHFFDAAPSELDSKKNYGIYVHSILSRLTYLDQLPATILTLEHEGVLSDEEKEGVSSQLNELFAIEKVRSWFSGEWEVKTEVPILLPDGSESRIDRLLLKDRRAVVIDFKTGERTSNDEQQVIDYLEILRSMNFIDVEGYLLYLKTSEIVSVAPPKGRIVKKKDNNQLELGI
jgi:ATP-dependent exoDNAse (exonuclease V) beta subunit